MSEERERRTYNLRSDDRLPGDPTGNGDGQAQVVSETMIHEAPELPELRSLDRNGLREIKDAYRQYEELCQSLGVKPKPLTSTIKDFKVRDDLKFGLLGHDPVTEHERVVTSAEIMRLIEEAEADQSHTDLVLEILPSVVEYPMELDSVRSRVARLTGSIVSHLRQYSALSLWNSKSQEEKYRRKHIVKAILQVIEPEPLREYLHMKVLNSSLQWDHKKTLKFVLEEGEKWQYVEDKRNAMKALRDLKVSDPLTNMVKANAVKKNRDPMESDAANVLAKPQAVQEERDTKVLDSTRSAGRAHAANESSVVRNQGKVIQLEHATCLNCKQPGFIRIYLLRLKHLRS